MSRVKYLEAPSKLPDDSVMDYKVFLAGGITGCSNWQAELRKKIESREGELCCLQNVWLLNPRRENFPIHDPNAARAQIKWEFEMLREADFVSFYFDAGQIQPIVMFELGAHSMRFAMKDCEGEPGPLGIIVGVHPGYLRKQDVSIQMELLFGPKFKCVDTLDKLASKIINYLNGYRGFDAGDKTSSHGKSRGRSSGEDH